MKTANAEIMRDMALEWVDRLLASPALEKDILFICGVATGYFGAAFVRYIVAG